MVLMIDNYDSFTYNLVQYFGELGADLEVHRSRKIGLDALDALNPERIVISPGPCTPKEAGISNDVIQHFAGKVPILGVLPRPSVHRGCVRGRRCESRSIDARQNLDDTARRG